MLFKYIPVVLAGLALVGLIQPLKAQQIPYSQYLNSPMYTNVAEVARATARQANLSYRQLGDGEEERITSYSVSYLHPFLNKKGMGQGGFGISALRESTGYLGMYQHSGLMAGYAHTAHLTQRMNLSAGVQIGWFQKSLDMSMISTTSQYSNGAYNPNAPTGESMGNSKSYLTISPGLLWQLTDLQGDRKAFLGFSLYNMNRPNTSFYSQPDLLAVNLVISGGYRLYRSEKLEVMPSFRHMGEGAATSLTNVGMVTNLILPSSGTLIKDGKLGLGTWYSSNRTAVVSLEITQPQYFIAFSYDMPLSAKVETRPGKSALEFMIGWRKALSFKAAQ